jgi:hypothetical protein
MTSVRLTSALIVHHIPLVLSSEVSPLVQHIDACLCVEEARAEVDLPDVSGAPAFRVSRCGRLPAEQCAIALLDGIPASARACRIVSS